MVNFRTSLNQAMLAIAAAWAMPAAAADLAAAPLGALSPAQVTAIRAVGRSVLAAKKSGSAEDPADTELLDRLRVAVDRLLAADLDPNQRGRITLQRIGIGAQRGDREPASAQRESARTDARALGTQLRSRGELMAARAHGTPENDTRSAGMPIGEQRARLFVRWSQKLQAALADDAPNRLGQLYALREQLQPTTRLTDAPLSHRTPTLQAMPAGRMSPKNAETSAKE